MKTDGEKLLNYFRDVQEEHGRDGCRCSECEEDMQEAYNRFKEDSNKGKV